MTAKERRVIEAAKAYVKASQHRWGSRHKTEEAHSDAVTALARTETELGKSVLALEES